MNSQEHYNQHLASAYSWMFGKYEDKLEENAAFFKRHHIIPSGSKVAVDLGAGSGFQSIPLAKAGFEVIAIDFSDVLLEELWQHAAGLPIKTLAGDIMNFESYANVNPEIIVCMTDTLIHLESIEDLDNLLINSYNILAPGGRFIISLRDLSNELFDENRFIPVRNDEKRILTCFLEFEQDHVRVFDMLHEKVSEKWIQKVSMYKKLRISIARINELLTKVGFIAEHSEVIRGMHFLILKKGT